MAGRKPRSRAAGRKTTAAVRPSTVRARATAGAATSEPAIIYIHGIGRQPPAEQVKLDWDLALFGRDMEARTRMAYRADIRHPVESGSVSTRARRLGPDADQEEVLAEADRFESDRDVAALVDEAGVPSRRRAAALTYGSRIDAKMTEHAPLGSSLRAAGLQAKVLPVPEWVRRRITAAATRLFIRDSAAYFFDQTQRQAMQARLRQELEAASGPIVLVSHSQGSIIAFDVLTALATRVSVPTWITIGSPLGIQEVQDHIGALVTPPAVTAWRNFADLLDPVALDKQLANDFSTVEGQSIQDETVVNEDSTSLVGFNPHSSTGYLSTDPVRQAVSAATGVPFDPLVFGGFFRRDVLHAMRDKTARHPVLIELRDPDAFGIASTFKHLSAESSTEEDQQQARVVERSQNARAHGTLTAHRDAVVRAIESVVRNRYGELAVEQLTRARIDPLRRFVAARLTTSEMQVLALQHGQHIYCVWKNSRKRKLIHRSADVVHVPAARIAYRANGEGITWAVLDTGVAGGHPHFQTHKTLADVWDCTALGPAQPVVPASSQDRDGHGTHVCGIVAGSQRDANGPSRHEGLAPRAKLRVYKVLDDNGEGDDGWIIKALDHIAETNERASDLVIHGVNLSLGGPFDAEVYGTGHSPICQELRRLWRQGVLACVACGNEGEVVVTTPEGEFTLRTQLSIGDPANLEECIAVGSVNADKPHLYGVSYFSSRGPTADGRIKPDVVAPGEGIASCAASWTRSPYVKLSGTSMACPHVSGLLASFLSVRKEFIGRPDEVKRILLGHCTDIGRDRTHQGHGIPNLLKMLSNT